MGRDFELPLQLDAREAERFHLAGMLGVDLRSAIFRDPAALLEFIHALLQARFSVDQSFSSVTHESDDYTLAIVAIFHPAVDEWFHAVFAEATAPQKRGWPAIARGESTLILAPTGSGKTLAAFLWCLNRLMFEPHRKKVYPSFPMSHVMDLPDTLAEIDAFRAKLAEHFITFDPGDVDEFVLHTTALKAMAEGQTTMEVQAAEGPVTLKTADVAQISGDIMGQIYARDFKMVDQSDMIVSLVPELPNGKPGLSSGVERELHHAFEGGKEVYVIWACRGMPSPFITEITTIKAVTPRQTPNIETQLMNETKKPLRLRT